MRRARPPRARYLARATPLRSHHLPSPQRGAPARASDLRSRAQVVARPVRDRADPRPRRSSGTPDRAPKRASTLRVPTPGRAARRPGRASIRVLRRAERKARATACRAARAPRRSRAPGSMGPRARAEGSPISRARDGAPMRAPLTCPFAERAMHPALARHAGRGFLNVVDHARADLVVRAEQHGDRCSRARARPRGRPYGCASSGRPRVRERARPRPEHDEGRAIGRALVEGRFVGGAPTARPAGPRA